MDGREDKTVDIDKERAETRSERVERRQNDTTFDFSIGSVLMTKTVWGADHCIWCLIVSQ